MVAAFEAVVTVASVVDELVVVEVVAAFDAVVSVADGLVAVDAAVVAVGVAASSDLHDFCPTNLFEHPICPNLKCFAASSSAAVAKCLTSTSYCCCTPSRTDRRRTNCSNFRPICSNYFCYFRSNLSNFYFRERETCRMPNS